MKRVVAIVVITMASLTAAACGADPTATPTAAPTNAPADHGAIETGEALFRGKGCSSCHGRDADGGIGPALAGHTHEQIEAQVRNPVGAMPAYTTEQISGEELDYIVAYIGSLDTEGVIHHDDHTIDEHHSEGHAH